MSRFSFKYGEKCISVLCMITFDLKVCSYTVLRFALFVLHFGPVQSCIAKWPELQSLYPCQAILRCRQHNTVRFSSTEINFYNWESFKQENCFESFLFRVSARPKSFSNSEAPWTRLPLYGTGVGAPSFATPTPPAPSPQGGPLGTWPQRAVEVKSKETRNWTSSLGILDPVFNILIEPWVCVT